jgi:Hint domain
VEFLVNHRSILWDDRARTETLYHIELESHDILLANGAPAESYRDDGNRWLFRNANSGWDLPPQQPCAPVLTGEPIVDAIWRHLLDRAGRRPGFVLTAEPDLHLEVDGRRLDAVSRRKRAYCFRLHAPPAVTRVVSRAGAPSELGLARDPRVLGVAIRQIGLAHGTQMRVMEASDLRLADGFHAFEADNDFRWTNGNATLPVALFDDFAGPIELVVQVGATARYIADADVSVAA